MESINLYIFVGLISQGSSVVTHVLEFISFYGYKVFHCMKLSEFVSALFSKQALGCFQFLAIAYGAAINSCMCLLLHIGEHWCWG